MHHRLKRLSSASFAFCALLLFACASLHAQLTTADLGGAVTDSTGAIIPGAQVTLIETGTRTIRKSQSNSDGAYSFNQIQPGIYSIKIEEKGFKSFSVSGISVAAGAHPRVDAKLEIGQTAETVEVTADSVSSLQTDSASLQSSVPEESVQDIPLNGRNFMNLVQVQPGVNAGNPQGISTGNQPDDRRQSTSISANGQSDFLNNNMVDGLDNNERYQGLLGFRPSIDAIAQVNVLTNDYPAEVGRSSGAVVNVITQAGTNKFHGTVFEYIRNDIFDAEDYFTAAGAPNPELRQNQFGGSIGGPLHKNKTFFFGAIELYRQVMGEAYTTTVPSCQERAPNQPLGACPIAGSYDFSDNGGHKLTAEQIAAIPATATAYYNLYPAPNVPGAVVNNYKSSPRRTQNSTTADIRVDHHFNDNNTLYVHYSYNPVTSFVPPHLPAMPDPAGKLIYSQGGGGFGGVITGLDGPSKTTAQGIAIDYLHIFTPNLVGEVKTGFTRINIQSFPLNYGSNLSADFGVQNAYLGTPDTASVPTVLFWGGNPYAALGDGFWEPILDTNNIYQDRGTVSWSHGNHSFKAGAAIIRRDLNYFQDAESGQGGFYSFFNFSGNSMEDFLTPSSLPFNTFFASRSNLLVHPGYRSWEPSFFVQDDWRVTPTLTLNLGVRYEIFTPFTEAHNKYANFNPSTVASTPVQVAGVNTSSTLGVKTDFSNFSPRLGFAQTLPAKAVIRGGLGFTFFPVDYQAPIANLNPPTSYTCIGCGATSFPVLPTPSVDPNHPVGALSYKPSNFRSGYSEQFNLTLEKEFAGIVARAGYVGELGRHLLWTTDRNLPQPAGANQTAPNWNFASDLPKVNNIYWWTNEATSSYHALQLSASTNAKHGLTFSANYTWSHGITDGTPEGTSNDGAGNVSGNIRLDKGNSQIDLRNRVAAVADYALPIGNNAHGLTALFIKGWQANALAYWQSGTAFSVLNGNDLTFAGPTGSTTVKEQNSERPSVVSGQSLKVSHPTINQWFNTAAFIGQPYGTPGNEARNQLEAPQDRRLDISLFKSFPIYRDTTLQFRAECYDITNTPNFGIPAAQGTFAPGGGNTTAGFGQISSTVANELPRQWQFALKLKF